MSLSYSLNRKCSRCPREERTDMTVEEIVRQAKSVDNKKAPNFHVSMEGVATVEFEFLCNTCRTIVERYLTHIAKRPKHQSALRGDAKIEVEEDE